MNDCSRGEWLTLDQHCYRSQSTKTKVTMNRDATQPNMNDAPFRFRTFACSCLTINRVFVAMKLPDTSIQVRLEKQERAREEELPSQGPFTGRDQGGASLFVRMWAYFGMREALSAFVLDGDPELAKVIRELITDAHGQITDRWPEGLVARFSNPLFALSAAKKLQQRLLTFQRSAPPQQLVASVLIC